MILQSRAAICCIVVLMVAAASVAGAAPGLDACVEIDEEAARLDCYDRIAGRAAHRGQLAVAEAENAAATAPAPASVSSPVTTGDTRDFGLSDSELRRRDRDQGAASPPKSMTRTVESVSRDGYGRFVVTLDGGQVWAQTERTSGAYPRAGDSVTITQGAMGGFRLRSERFGTVRVRRLR